jgi:hypothetical protein
MKKRNLWLVAGVVAFIVLALLQAPHTAKLKAECDKRGGYYDYKSTACWSNGGYEILGWKR